MNKTSNPEGYPASSTCTSATRAPSNMRDALIAKVRDAIFAELAMPVDATEIEDPNSEAIVCTTLAKAAVDVFEDWAVNIAIALTPQPADDDDDIHIMAGDIELCWRCQQELDNDKTTLRLPTDEGYGDFSGKVITTHMACAGDLENTQC